MACIANKMMLIGCLLIASVSFGSQWRDESLSSFELTDALKEDASSITQPSDKIQRVQDFIAKNKKHSYNMSDKTNDTNNLQANNLPDVVLLQDNADQAENFDIFKEHYDYSNHNLWLKKGLIQGDNQ